MTVSAIPDKGTYRTIHVIRIISSRHRRMLNYGISKLKRHTDRGTYYLPSRQLKRLSQRSFSLCADLYNASRNLFIHNTVDMSF